MLVVILHHLLNVSVQIANKGGFKNNWQFLQYCKEVNSIFSIQPGCLAAEVLINSNVRTKRILVTITMFR
jgi:hypothetical protein